MAIALSGLIASPIYTLNMIGLYIVAAVLFGMMHVWCEEREWVQVAKQLCGPSRHVYRSLRLGACHLWPSWRLELVAN